MIIRLQRYTIEEKRNVAGDVLSARYGYVIVFWKWRRWRFRKYYLRLLPKWYDDYCNGNPVSVQLTRVRREASEFFTDTSNYMRKSLAEEIIKEIKNDPDKFVLE